MNKKKRPRIGQKKVGTTIDPGPRPMSMESMELIKKLLEEGSHGAITVHLPKETINVTKNTLTSGEALFLCSDGLYESEHFESGVKELLAKKVTEPILNKFFMRNAEYFNDDVSLVILQRLDLPESYREICNEVVLHNLDFRQHNLMAHQMAAYLQEEMHLCVMNLDSNGLQQSISYFTRWNLCMDEDFILHELEYLKTAPLVDDDYHDLLIRQLKKIRW